jgi:polyhydroxyalkanoate synthesis regulator phasin
MPQSKSAKPASTPPKSTGGKPAAKRATPAKAAAKPAAKPKAAAAKKPAGAGKKPAAPRGGAKAAPRTAAPAQTTPAAVHADPSSPEAQAARDEAMKANLSQLRELLAGGVMLTAQRVQEAMDDAVRRGKMTRRDAEEVARGLVDNGRRQSLDLIAEIEQLFGRGRNDLETASTLVAAGTDRVLREVDRVRRQAGVGPTFPILGYDDLTAAQVAGRLSELDAGELRKVREHEKRTANRKSVLAAVEKALG